MTAAAVVGTSLIGGLMSSNAQEDAASAAAGAQTAASQAGIAEQQRQFNEILKLLQPYTQAGASALPAYSALAGAGTPEQQQQAIQAVQASPEFQAALSQGENAILQNASATGGLRGGNVQGALAQFRPNLLSQAINNRFNRLGGLVSTGLGAATNTGSAGQNTANAVTSLLGDIGSAQAGSALASGQAQSNLYGALANSGGLYGSLKGIF